MVSELALIWLRSATSGISAVGFTSASAENRMTLSTRSILASNTPSKFCMCGRCSAWQESHSKKEMPD
ncbi:Uncharacterised protein [Acinetobacter baumannii]|nr:Uncharacterised protein [Acinetobacter baumannii]